FELRGLRRKHSRPLDRLLRRTREEAWTPHRAGLIERDRHQLFNVAVLIGPDGKVVGKYRKVCLPDGEYDKGMSPGSDYPVFDTRLGKVGMMICYDGFFPEVARELSNRGAEIIAWPVWG